MSNTSDEMEVVVEWASSSPLHALVAACEHDAVVVSVDGLVCGANEQRAPRRTCRAADGCRLTRGKLCDYCRMHLHMNMSFR